MNISEIFNYIFWLNAIIAVIIIIFENRPPEVSVSWILIIIFFPGVGLVIFALFGINWKKTKLTRQSPETLFSQNLETVLNNQKRFFNSRFLPEGGDGDKNKLMSLLLNSSNSIITVQNQCKIYNSGNEFFHNLLSDLENAKDSIHLEFFIWTSDSLGESIKDILVKKAKEGVEVRLIFDGIGSFGRISFKYKRELRKAGIKYKYFLDLAAPVSVIKINYCNHRKIAVIDGKVAYTGGMNVGTEYITGGKRFESWRDTNIRIEGESVKLLQTVFLVDWYNSGDKLLIDKKYFPETEAHEHPEQKLEIPIQVVTSGADSFWDSIQQMYFTMITNANKEIYIQTPYFIPDQSIMTALQTAALSGVSVNILMTGIPDKLIPFWAAHTYFLPLLNAGVNIFLYKKGFLHSKTMIIDNSIVTIGTCNVDMRSFHINYEINVLIFNSVIAEEMVQSFYQDLKDSETVTREYLEKIGLLRKMRNSAIRILSPVM